MTAPDSVFTEEQVLHLRWRCRLIAMSGRVYPADYSCLDGSLEWNPASTADPGEAMRTFLALRLSWRSRLPWSLLRPVAIQCGQTRQRPVITPSTGLMLAADAKLLQRCQFPYFSGDHFALHYLVESLLLAHRQLLIFISLTIVQFMPVYLVKYYLQWICKSINFAVPKVWTSAVLHWSDNARFCG